MEGLPRYQSFLSSNCRNFDSRAATFTYWSSSKWQKELKLGLHLAAQGLPAVVAGALGLHQVVASQLLRLRVHLVGEEERAGGGLGEPGGQHHPQPRLVELLAGLHRDEDVTEACLWGLQHRIAPATSQPGQQDRLCELWICVVGSSTTQVRVFPLVLPHQGEHTDGEDEHHNGGTDHDRDQRHLRHLSSPLPHRVLQSFHLRSSVKLLHFCFTSLTSSPYLAALLGAGAATSSLLDR